MSEDNRLKRSKKRNESGLHGKHYERKILSLIALKCLLDEDIQDFWLLSNPKDINKFDDIILLTEHRNEGKKLFFIQIKHKLQGTKRPIVADKLDNGNDKDLSLKMYQDAFFEIKMNTDFFESNEVPDDVEMYFILFNNCKVTRNKENKNIRFDCSSSDHYNFIDSSLDQKNILKITNENGKYDKQFLDGFYFYTEQLNGESINPEIGNLLGIYEENVDAVLNFFYSWVEPKDNNYCTKLSKIDIKMKILDIFLGDFQPPLTNTNMSESILINMINKFDVTVLSRDNSVTIVWNEIFFEIRNFCGDLTIKLTTWQQESVSDSVKEKLYTHLKSGNVLLKNSKNITIRQLYIFLVTQRKVPFFIKASKFYDSFTNELYNNFTNKLLPSLGIYFVIFNDIKDNLIFPDGFNVFQNFSNIKAQMYFKYSKQLNISLQGSYVTDLYTLLKNNDKAKCKISADDYIELLYKDHVIDEMSNMSVYYINRQVKMPILSKDVLNENEFMFFIFKFPYGAKISGHKCVHFNEYIFFVYDEVYVKSNCAIVVTEEYKFKSDVVQLIELTVKNRIYYLLTYIDESKFMLLHTNGPTEVLRPYLTYVPKKDIEVIDINKNFNINIICNNAGMGKSMFLQFIHSKLAPEDWVIGIDLKKYHNSVKNVKTLEELISFCFDCQPKDKSETIHSLLKILYKTLKQKIIWLVDDYEEVNDSNLLQLFKSASQHGFRIWIVARPFLKLEFENTFGVFCMELENFNKEDQVMFIEKYLKQKNRDDENIRKIMMAIDNIRYLLEDSFIGICQQTMMLTEIFSNYEEDWREHEWHIQDIYERFFKLKINDSNVLHKEWYTRTLSKLALQVFFKDNALEKAFDLEEFVEDVHLFKKSCPKDFFITEFIAIDVPIFSHRTYAEFLAARWLAHTVEKQLNDQTPFDISSIIRLLHLQELNEVRLFFDNMLTKRLPLHSAIINKEEGKIKKLIDEPDRLSETDLLGRSIFHLLSSYGTYFDVGISKETKDCVRNLEEHSKIVKSEGNILLKPIESVKRNGLNTNIAQYLQKLTIYKGIIVSLKPDAFLKLDCTEYALLSGSLQELDELLRLRNFATTFHLSLSEEVTYFLLFHCIQNKYNNILSNLNVKGFQNVKIGNSQSSLLHLAINSRNMKAVKKLIEEHNLDEWGVDAEGNTPFHIACDQKINDIIEYLFNLKNMDLDFLNRKNSKNQSHLYFLARRGLTKWINKIIRKFPRIEIDSECCNGNTPFIMSIIFNNVGAATILRSHGANVNHKNTKNKTALHYAASKGFKKCVTNLLNWDADINLKDDYGTTPLMKASSWGQKNIVLSLLNNNAKINLSDQNKRTALHHAVRRNHIEVIELLLIHDANVNCVTKKKESPLTIACKFNYSKVVKLLLSCDITVSKVRALKLAIEKNHEECIQLLL